MDEATSTRKVRILFVTHSLDKGGMEEVILLYAKCLDARRYDVVIAYRTHGVIAAEIGALTHVQLYCYNDLSRWKRVKNLIGCIDAVRPDIVHNHFTWIGAVAAFLKRIPCVETIHNLYGFFSFRQKVIYALFSLLVTRFIAVSREVLEYTVTTFKLIPRRKITVVYNGVDTAVFQPVSDTKRIRELFGLQPGDCSVGFIGRIEEQKGLRYLLESAKDLNVCYSHLRFLIAGEGTLQNELEQKARSMGLQNIMFLGYRRDTPLLYNTFDVFVLPSLYEGFPVSLVEAMATGCPVVAARTGGISEAVESEVTGILVEPGDASSLTVALKRMIDDPERADEMGRNGRLKVQQDFSKETMIAMTETVYAGVIPEHPRFASASLRQ